MRTIEYTSRFKRDYKRIAAGRYGRILERELRAALDLLIGDSVLPPRYRDHALIGEWNDCRDCHLRPDLGLIYRKTDDDRLQLARLGSHSDLSL